MGVTGGKSADADRGGDAICGGDGGGRAGDRSCVVDSDGDGERDSIWQ